jgi:hypothetical protein
MYTKALRDINMWKWGMMKYYPAKYLRFMFTMDPTKPKVVT